MANNYSQFSEAIGDLTSEERAWVENILLSRVPEDPENNIGWFEERGITLKDYDEGPWPDFGWKLIDDDKSLWLYSQEGFNWEHLVGFVGAFLRKFRPMSVVTFTGAET